MKTYAFVFARGGSKGLPNKNILPIAGKPLLAHSIEIASTIREISKIFVSTDSLEIMNIAKDFGAEVIRRPDYLATDIAPEWLAWQHAIKWAYEKYGDFDCFVSLPPTAPLRQVGDVQSCIDAFTSSAGIDCVVAINSSSRNPWFNMVKYIHGQEVERVISDRQIHRRQDAPMCFDMTTVAYVLKPRFILNATSLWDGKILGVEIPHEHSIDIDTELDFEMAKFLMETWLPQSDAVESQEF